MDRGDEAKLTDTGRSISWLIGGGQMAHWTRNHNWATTSLGPLDTWPDSLRVLVNLVFTSPLPLCLLWGPQLLTIYNDEFRPELEEAAGLPHALGQPASSLWAESWRVIGPPIDRVLASGTGQILDKGVWSRHRPPGDRPYSISPVSDETGAVAGILLTGLPTYPAVTPMIQLAESEQRFQNLIREATVGIIVLTGQTMQVSIVNDAYSQLIDRTCAELIGRPLFEVIPEAEAYFRPILDTVCLSGEPQYLYTVPYAVTAKQGYLNLVYQPYREADGQITGVMVLCQDVTQQVLDQQRVQESEARFRAIAEGTEILIAVGDPVGKLTYVNHAWVAFTGRTSAELLRLGWVDLIHPEDKLRYLSGYSQGSFSGEFRLLNQLGHYRWLSTSKRARFTDYTQLTGHVSAYIDITDRKTYQQELERALEQVRLSKEAAQLGTFDMDLLQGTMEWDERCRTLFGISHQQPVSYERDFVAGLHPQDRQRIIAIIKDTFKRSISQGNYDVEYRTVGVDDQRVRWVRAKGKVYFDAHDKPIRFIGSVLDITQQVDALKRIEETVAQRTQELAAANHNLQKSNAELAQFAYIASHDLQEPLRKISTFAHILDESVGHHLGEPASTYVTKIKTSSDRMRTLISDVLAYSRLVDETETLEVVNLNHTLTQVLADHELLIAQTGASIQVEPLPTIEAISLQMTQLLTNLLNNALKFRNPDRPPVLSIRPTELEPASLERWGLSPELTYVRIQLIDNGIGVGATNLERIFNIFQRLHPQSNYEGTGIGLALCKKIILNHRGAIYAEDRPEGGSIFSVILPLSR